MQPWCKQTSLGKMAAHIGISLCCAVLSNTCWRYSAVFSCDFHGFFRWLSMMRVFSNPVGVSSWNMAFHVKRVVQVATMSIAVFYSFLLLYHNLGTSQQVNILIQLFSLRTLKGNRLRFWVTTPDPRRGQLIEKLQTWKCMQGFRIFYSNDRRVHVVICYSRHAW